MKPFWKIFLVLALIAGGGAYWWAKQPGTKPAEGGAKVPKSEGKAPGKRGAGGPVSVSTVKAEKASMPVQIEAVGTVESEHSVAVRPQLNGTLEAVLFKEGDRVKAGQALFRIDARAAQATLDQARAALARDQAQLAQAKAQEARLRPLMEKDYVTRQEYDVAATAAKALESTVNANKAAVDQAQLQLSYSQVTAPIGGRTGSLSVRAGNLVTAGTGGAPLVIINSTQPILVSLSVAQRFLDDVRKYWGTPDLKVEISANPGAPTLAEGQLVFIDNTVNTTTGTITLKARVKNEKEELWPGQFIAARIVLRVDREALVLPEAAVLPGQDGTFVYAVREGRAKVTKVKVDRQIGGRVVIADGIGTEDEVIVNPPPSVTDGTPIAGRDGSKAAAPEGKGDGSKKGKKDGKGEGGKQEPPPAKDEASREAKS